MTAPIFSDAAHGVLIWAIDDLGDYGKRAPVLHIFRTLCHRHTFTGQLVSAIAWCGDDVAGSFDLYFAKPEEITCPTCLEKRSQRKQ